MVTADSPSITTPTKRPSLLRRVATFVVMATGIGCVMHFAAGKVHNAKGRAGFLQGIVHGAMMPIALPNLLVGSDVTIYAESNTGRTYKLGYTVGVNGCGAIFFGLFFWRVNRWRKGVF